MDLIIDPPRGVGPIEVGMPFEEVERALQSIPGSSPPAPGEKRAPGFAHYDSEMSIAVDQAPGGRVRSIEIYRPTEGVEIRFAGLSVFATPADEVIRRLGEMTEVEV